MSVKSRLRATLLKGSNPQQDIQRNITTSDYMLILQPKG